MGLIENIINYDFMTIVYIIIILALLSVVIFFFVVVSKFKYNVTLRNLTKDRKVITKHKAKEVLLGGQRMWRINRERVYEKKFIPIPPPEAIEIDNKGRYCVDAYRFPTGEVVYIEDKNKVQEPPYELMDNIPKEIESIEDPIEKEQKLKKWRKKVMDEWRTKNNVVTAYNAITTNQRGEIINQIRQAKEFDSGSWWKQNGITVVALGAIVMLVMGLMVFWGDIAQPALKGQDLQKQTVTIQNENLKLLQQIKNDIQHIKGQQEAGEDPPN